MSGTLENVRKSGPVSAAPNPLDQRKAASLYVAQFASGTPEEKYELLDMLGLAKTGRVRHSITVEPVD